MNCRDIEIILNELTVTKNGRIRGKNRVIDKIHSMHLREVDKISSKPDVIKSGCTHQFKYAAEDVMYRCVNCDAEVK